MNQRSVPQAVIDNQHDASDPEKSAWVSANAGAGKTHVLAQRVIRLLLGGSSPEKILCLTFTKAAAANMANRIFDTLRDWIALDDAKLDKAIAEMGAAPGGKKQRGRARRLFAAALETPGGLKVQTIHGFCTRLLQQFPFEANAPARFRVLEEVEQQQMLEQLRRIMLFEASGNPDSPAGRALTAIIPATSDWGFQEGLLEAIREREPLLAWVEDAGGIAQTAVQLSDALGIAPDDTLEAVEKNIIDGPNLPSSSWLSVAGICSTGSPRDKDQTKRLQDAIAATGRPRVDTYLKVFYSPTTGNLRGALITNAISDTYPELKRQFADEKARLPALCERRKAVLIRDRTIALVTLALNVIGGYRDEKNRRGLLDYDDLIARTGALLNNVDSRWVHYKLDLGIDHLLIDEAQDTSPEQWGIIKKFVEEFTAGAGARSHIKRTIFAVGDDKQSIFSFQGARPLEFDETRNYFQRAHDAADLVFQFVRSTHSFRSVPLVLNAVDAVFKQEAAHEGLTADPVATIHQAVRDKSPGLVELWPLVEPEPKKDIDPWDQPFDKTSETSPRVKLARQIADAVKEWLRRGYMVGDGDKRHPLRAGDILILVRQRGPLFEAIIRALKSADIAVAGADRLKLAEHIAIMDLLALADALLHPLDTLALATVLKSPLFGLSDEQLIDLTSQQGSLRAALRGTMPEIGNAIDVLEEESRTLPPFTFYARLLGGGARKRFLARLGTEANDALDEFLNLALAYETRQNSLAAGLRALAAHRFDRSEARHGDCTRRGACDDRARCQRPGGSGRCVSRYHDGTSRPAGPPSQAAVAGAASRHTRPHCLDDDQERRHRPRQPGAYANDPRERERISPPALCRDDPRRRPADRVWRGWPKQSAAGLLVSPHRARLGSDGRSARREWRHQGHAGPEIPDVRARNRQSTATRCRCIAKPARLAVRSGEDRGAAQRAAAAIRRRRERNSCVQRRGDRAPARVGARHPCASPDAIAARRAGGAARRRRAALSRAAEARRYRAHRDRTAYAAAARRPSLRQAVPARQPRRSFDRRAP